ncbi:hypothetical protein [Ectobacillus ponti]|uniref:Uncharacterized protein n=1 Tax=Ectobacillus ponti TaxID=2961894 RepID=A0AA41X7G1_9BACI|nr:hypothetical protein [Ectobacillus ponti]MCP8970319.1 hypothetical protein [Ectobacillus ponti]
MEGFVLFGEPGPALQRAARQENESVLRRMLQIWTRKLSHLVGSTRPVPSKLLRTCPQQLLP